MRPRFDEEAWVNSEMGYYFDIAIQNSWLKLKYLISHLGFEVSHVTRQAMRHGQLHHRVLGKSSIRQTKTGVKSVSE